jgi:ribonuclease HII
VKPDLREDLFAAIEATAESVVVAIRPAAVIDREGLHRTNIEALSSALTGVCDRQAVAFSDGFEVPVRDGSSEKLIRGDSRSAAVAAASIIAKVVRDRHMQKAADLFPGYGFERHVGYATEEHRDALQRLGPTSIHRRSFKSAAYESAA